MLKLSLIATSRGYSNFSARPSHCGGFSCCRTRALEGRLSGCGIHRLSGSTALESSRTRGWTPALAGRFPTTWSPGKSPTLVSLPEKSHGQRSLAGCSPWGHKRIRHNLATKQQQSIFYKEKKKCKRLGGQPPEMRLRECKPCTHQRLVTDPAFEHCYKIPHQILLGGYTQAGAHLFQNYRF